jgi:hypothetical protein
MNAVSAASVTESHETANPFPDLPVTRGSDASSRPACPTPTARQLPTPLFSGYYGTRFESRIAFAGLDGDAEEIVIPTGQFSLLETTSGLSGNSRGA